MNDEVWLVVGLGNPGPRYESTRHNAGRMVVDELAERVGTRFTRHKCNAQVAEARVVPGGPRLVLAKPNTFMNVSGPPVAQLAKFYSLTPEHVVIVHDELDLPFDTVRLKQGGGHGGHNGLRDIIPALGSPDFVRVRVGVGRPQGSGDAADHVLSPFSAAERRNLPVLVSDAADAVTEVITDGLLAAQQRFHAPRA